MGIFDGVPSESKEPLLKLLEATKQNDRRVRLQSAEIRRLKKNWSEQEEKIKDLKIARSSLSSEHSEDHDQVKKLEELNKDMDRRYTDQIHNQKRQIDRLKAKVTSGLSDRQAKRAKISEMSRTITGLRREHAEMKRSHIEQFATSEELWTRRLHEIEKLQSDKNKLLNELGTLRESHKLTKEKTESILAEKYETIKVLQKAVTEGEERYQDLEIDYRREMKLLSAMKDKVATTAGLRLSLAEMKADYKILNDDFQGQYKTIQDLTEGLKLAAENGRHALATISELHAKLDKRRSLWSRFFAPTAPHSSR